MTFDSLAGDEEFPSDFLVGETPCDETEYLSLAGSQLVELGVERRLGLLGLWERGEGIEDESGEPRGKDRFAFRDSVHRIDQVGP